MIKMLKSSNYDVFDPPRAPWGGDQNDDFWHIIKSHDSGWAAVVISITPRGPDSKEKINWVEQICMRRNKELLNWTLDDMNWVAMASGEADEQSVSPLEGGGEGGFCLYINASTWGSPARRQDLTGADIGESKWPDWSPPWFRRTCKPKIDSSRRWWLLGLKFD